MNDQRKHQPINAAETARDMILVDVAEHCRRMDPGAALMDRELAKWILDTHDVELAVVYPGFEAQGATDIAVAALYRLGFGREFFDSVVVCGEIVHVRRPA